MELHKNRRIFLSTIAAGVSTPLLIAQQKSNRKKEESEEEVSPAEDLMREHGVLKRVLLIYREAMRRIDAHQDFPPDALADSAKLIRRFETARKEFSDKELVDLTMAVIAINGWNRLAISFREIAGTYQPAPPEGGAKEA
jgi:hypothetical protein